MWNTHPMANISEKTFESEGRSFIGIDGIFWGTAAEYPVDPFARILDDLEVESCIRKNWTPISRKITGGNVLAVVLFTRIERML